MTEPNEQQTPPDTPENQSAITSNPTSGSKIDTDMEQAHNTGQAHARYIASFVVTLFDTRFGKILAALAIGALIFLNMSPEQRQETVDKYQNQIVSSVAGILMATFLGAGGNKDA